MFHRYRTVNSFQNVREDCYRCLCLWDSRQSICVQILIATAITGGTIVVRLLHKPTRPVASSFAVLNHTVKPVLSGHSKKKTKIGSQDRLSLNAGQKYCRMLHRKHSSILSTFNKLPFVIKSFVWSIFEWPLMTGFTVRQRIIICHTLNVAP